MQHKFEPVFQRLRAILQKNKGALTVTDDSDRRYCLQGKPGPAAVRMSAGARKQTLMPVAWVEIGKSYVSYHLMGIYANPKAQAQLSRDLRARMQGKSCFNFKECDDALFAELEQVTARVNAEFQDAGFVSGAQGDDRRSSSWRRGAE